MPWASIEKKEINAITLQKLIPTNENFPVKDKRFSDYKEIRSPSHQIPQNSC